MNFFSTPELVPVGFLPRASSLRAPACSGSSVPARRRVAIPRLMLMLALLLPADTEERGGNLVITRTGSRRAAADLPLDGDHRVGDLSWESGHEDRQCDHPPRHDDRCGHFAGVPAPRHRGLREQLRRRATDRLRDALRPAAGRSGPRPARPRLRAPRRAAGGISPAAVALALAAILSCRRRTTPGRPDATTTT
jgi:hypothetical protein